MIGAFFFVILRSELSVTYELQTYFARHGQRDSNL
jgi:hypothetical protein